MLGALASYGQNGVGINTNNPRTTLEVNGSVTVNGQLLLDNPRNITDGEPSTFVVQDNTNQVRALNLSTPTSPGLGYLQTYILTNTGLDFVRDFDTQIDASKYVVVIVSSFYNQRLQLNGSDYSIPYASAFVSGGTWHLTANYPIARDESASLIGEWNINTLIFTNNLSKQYTSMTVDMTGNTTGSAVNPIVD